MGLGSYPTVSVSKARLERDALKKRIRAGIDPLAERDAALASTAEEDRITETRRKLKAATFRTVAEEYVSNKEAAWSNLKHRQQWRNTLRDYAHPVIGDVPVSEITTDHVLAILKPIWATKTETASRVQGRMESILDYARSMKLRDTDNPARWKGHIDTILPAPSKVKSVTHYRSLSYFEAPTLASSARASDTVASRALLLTMLCAVRTKETLEAKWGEFDLEAREWRIPASRMKAGKEQRVPLSDPALEVLKTQLETKRNDWVFPSPQRLKNKPLSSMAMLKWLERNDWSDKTVTHGLRTTMTSWAEEQTHYPQRLIDVALSHQLSDKAQKAYFRGDLMDKRRELMDEWANFLLGSETSAHLTESKVG